MSHPTRSPRTAPVAPGARGLPRVLLLTDRRQTTVPLVDVVAAAVGAGVRAVVLREKDLGRDDRLALAAELGPVIHRAGGVLITGGELLAGADGVHQAASGAGRPAGGVVGRSCHDVPELRRAASDGVDYVTVSPVFASRSKPGYGPALGAEGLADLVATTPVPVFALGGVETAEAARACRDAGAHGVAVMGAVMRARRPADLVAELLAAVGEGVT